MNLLFLSLDVTSALLNLSAGSSLFSEYCTQHVIAVCTYAYFHVLSFKE